MESVYTQIRVSCITNLDDYDCSHIKSMVCKPSIGEYVTVKHKGYESWLKVTGMRHECRNNQPILIVELGR